MNCIFIMLIAMGQMESKLGIPSLRDIGTCKQKLASEYLLYFENSACNVILYSNSRNII
jgi:hypothetical protein